MDLWNATLASGYEPYTDEFDVVMDVEQLVPVERVKRIASFLEEYAGARVERLELPERDPVEYIIAIQREDKDDLLQGIPRGQGRRHLVDFSRAANALDGRVAEMISSSGLDPAETSVSHECRDRLKNARSVVYAKGEGLADDVLQGFFQATSAAFDRQLEIRLEHSVLADVADMEGDAEAGPEGL